MVSVYANKVDIFEGYDLVKRRVYTFLNNKYTLLKVLSPTENDAYEQHLKRAALATAIDKSSHIYKPNAVTM